MLVEGNKQSFLGTGNRGDGRLLADHVLLHDGGFLGLAGDLVIFFQRHDEHGVGVLAEFDEVGHAADDAAVSGLAEGSLVDGTVKADEAVVGRVELTAGFAAVFLGPAVILRLQHPASLIRRPIRAARRLPVMVPLAFKIIPP